MRVHRLEIEAFGPFVERQVVDVDALAAQHLFLLHGETGAGKTTVLDALCFGLYGEVPGVRQGAGHLRSDHAAPDAEPRVVLEVTVRGRRLKLTRTPKWQRPKKRGSGTTTAQASVTLEERVDAEWVHLSSRIDETNHLVGGLVGLTREQFCQVVVLPQGQFASFLRAGSDERRGLLQRIFSTGRFADVERWLVDRRIQARRDSDEHHDGVRSLVARLTEAAGQPWPESWPAADLASVAASGELAEYAEEVLEDARRQVTGLDREADRSTTVEAEARGACENAERLAAEVARATRSRTVLADLERRADELATMAQQHDAAQRARPVAEARRGADRAVARLDHARAATERARRAAEGATTTHGPSSDHGGARPVLDRSAVAAALGAAHECRAEAVALAPTQRDADEARRGARDATQQLARRVTALHDLEQGATDLPQRRATVLTELARLRPEAGELEPARVRVEAAAERLSAARDVVAYEAQVTASQSLVQHLRRQSQDLREAYLDCRERRIEGMAGELALDLAVGHGCPVCGSCEHPSPAGRGGAAESQQTEDDARRAAEDASVAEQAAEQDGVRLRSHLDHALSASGGLDVPSAATAHDEAREALRTARAAAEQVARHEQDLERIADEQGRHEQQLAAARSDAAAAEASCAAARHRDERVRAQLADALDRFSGLVRRGAPEAPAETAETAETAEAPADTAEGWRDHFTHHVQVLEALLAALDEQHAAHTASQHATAHLHEVAHAAGFPDPETAAAASLEPTHLEALAAQVARADRDRHAAEQVLDGVDPAVRPVLDGDAPAPDLDDLRRRLTVATQHCRAASTAATTAGDRSRRLVSLAADLTTRLAAWAPAREHHRAVADLAATVEGKGSDNPLQMRLSAYVLASRLSQVVAAANERLEGMAEQRYELEHTAFKGAGDRRGGLSLRVVDSWTGESRDPATLSGGETFVVALALALGLADVVTQEAGGAEIDTLFVDEGFGSLDPHTLDRVMDCLDDLRSGGRSVGVVSHVAELRSRIPDQLHVVKTTRGSMVRARHGDESDTGAELVGARG